MTENFRVESRKAYSSGDSERNATLEQINTGSLQRIADAAESMAKGYASLEQQLKSARASVDYWRSEAEALKYKLRGARGTITKLRNRIASGGYQPAPSNGTLGEPPKKP